MFVTYVCYMLNKITYLLTYLVWGRFETEGQNPTPERAKSRFWPPDQRFWWPVGGSASDSGGTVPQPRQIEQWLLSICRAQLISWAKCQISRGCFLQKCKISRNTILLGNYPYHIHLKICHQTINVFSKNAKMLHFDALYYLIWC